MPREQVFTWGYWRVRTIVRSGVSVWTSCRQFEVSLSMVMSSLPGISLPLERPYPRSFSYICLCWCSPRTIGLTGGWRDGVIILFRGYTITRRGASTVDTVTNWGDRICSKSRRNEIIESIAEDTEEQHESVTVIIDSDLETKSKLAGLYNRNKARIPVLYKEPKIVQEVTNYAGWSSQHS